MKCYLINLDRSPQRLEHMTTAFGAIGIDFVRVPATDGSLLSAREVKEITGPKSDEMPWTHQEVGVAISQRRCWQMIAEGDDEYGAVFEDDVFFSDDAAKYLFNYDWIRADIDVLKLETVGTKVSVSFLGTAAGSRRVHRLYSNHWGAGAYVLSRRLARKLVSRSEIFTDQPDVVLFRQPGDISAFQLIPAICIQDLVLNGHLPDTKLSSTLEDERVPLRKKNPRKPRGWKKLRRELTRPFEQLTSFATDAAQPLFGKRTLRVPYR
ncbi:glycosyl transferase family 25 [Mesorhizobium soli]|uniref:glycosyltransferase family 25 protein n=1 Tax=Pseudaminobacter soli (ex Li et al. 2025) TaxID=1295366 RepID=UPI00247614FE|nr:glycosyltransferase family 25 protein [Mesorhizobium soli]MDH6234329.1 glycosyl transferase family 25 [Mesorhizobium soli]